MLIKDRVANGVMWLDATVPGWWQKIDLSIFDLRGCTRCILGQVFHEYVNQCTPRGLVMSGFGYVVQELFDNESIDDEVYNCGFGRFGIQANWDEATVLWRDVIAERQNPTAPVERKTLVEV
jgi:hypothetical protein